MGAIRDIAITILSLSLIVFIALFGRLPIFRKTPIGFCHRVVWVYLPRGFLAVDNRLTGGRIFSCLRRLEDYLMNQKHPVVLIFFILLQSISQILFVPAAWPKLSVIHHFLIPPVIIVAYYLLYMGYATPSTINNQNHPITIRQYPYDHTLYHPGIWCRTCQFPKPARSKHCSTCKVCVAKMDHHCIWLNNCVGRNNYFYFLALLVSVSTMLAYASVLGHGILDAHLQSRLTTKHPGSQHWSKSDPPMTWSLYFHTWSLALSDNVRVGSVTLLAALSFPLSTCLFIYHLYLIWAGMTTNESDKWADWRDAITWGTVWRAKRAALLEDYPLAHPALEPREPDIDSKWKGDKSIVRDERAGEGPNRGWWVIRFHNGDEIPRRWRPKKIINSIEDSTSSSSSKEGTTHGLPQQQEQQQLPQQQQQQQQQQAQKKPEPELEPGEPDERWQRVESLTQLVNIYDLGFWGNIKDVVFNRGD